jgi:P-type Ca2+ transporter type 2C
VQGISYSPIGEVDGIPYQTEVQLQPLGAVADIAAVCALCNDARIIGKDATAIAEGDEKGAAEDTVDGSGKVVNKAARTGGSSKSAKPAAEKAYERVGEPTEAALCVLAEKLGGMAHYLEDSHNYLHDRQGLHFNVPPSVLASANVNVWRDKHPRVATLEFSRDRKSMSVLTRFEQGDYPTPSEFHIGVTPRRAGNRLLVKGAPNLLLERCTHVKFRDGTVARLSGSLRRALETKVSEMAARPLRCLALAVKEHDELEDSLKDFDPQSDRDTTRHPLLSDPNNYRNIESGLCFLGIVGIKDPARPEVADSIKLCSKAGIRVMMITGDAKDTAVAIARDVNIFPSDSDADSVKAFEGRDFFEKPPGEQLDILREGNVVFCRTEPADKQKLVKMLQSLGEIAAMTGDGVNDAPALQQAAIGVAMGVTGTEVSKEAADMILADDNFSTIVSAVEEGRRIYANMQAFICFLISCNIGEICAIFLATLAGFPEPLTAMHLLWVNLVTGTCILKRICIFYVILVTQHSLFDFISRRTARDGARVQSACAGPHGATAPAKRRAHHDSVVAHAVLFDRSVRGHCDDRGVCAALPIAGDYSRRASNVEPVRRVLVPSWRKWPDLRRPVPRVGTDAPSDAGADDSGVHGDAQGAFRRVGGQLFVPRRAAVQSVAPRRRFRASAAAPVRSLQLQVWPSRARRKLWNGTAAFLCTSETILYEDRFP